MFLSFSWSLCAQHFHYFLFLQPHVSIIIIITRSAARRDESDNGFEITPCYLHLVTGPSVWTDVCAQADVKDVNVVRSECDNT